MTDVEIVAEAAVQDAFTRALQNFKGTFSFERKVNLGNYESATAAVFVQFDYAPDADMEDFLASAREAALWGKSIVYEQLGREAHLQGTGPDAVLMEVIQDAFPGTTTEHVAADPRDSRVVPNQPTDAPHPAVEQVGPTPPHAKETVDAASDAMKKAMRKENADWAKARYATHPNEFYDNRAKKAAEGWTSPDFTHKQSRAGFYEN